MLVAYTYKLKPSKSQALEMGQHVEMLRLQYNYRLRERELSYRQAAFPAMGNYSDIYTKAECCPLTSSVSKNALYGEPFTTDKKTGKVKRRNALAQQDADLPNLKKSRPWYGRIQHHVLQQMLRRVDDAFQRFFKGLADYPKPKRRSKYHSFSYPPGDVRFQGNKVRLPGMGWMGFYQSRPFPDGFAVKTVTVRRKTDGWYICVRLQDDSVPVIPAPNEVKSAVGVDLGITKIVSISNGKTVPNPRFYAKQERRRTIRSRAASRKKLGSRNRRKAYQYLARLENRVTNQRTDFQWKLAHKITRCTDCVIFEDLNIKGMMKRCKPKQDEETGTYLPNGQAAKRGLNRSIWDAAWGELKQKVKVVAAKSGILFYEIDPRHTSQECSMCGFISPKNRDGEKFLCESCGQIADADIDAAITIRQRGLTELGISIPLPGVPRKVTPKNSTKVSPGREYQQQYVESGNHQQVEFKTLKGIQLNLFEWMGV